MRAELHILHKPAQDEVLIEYLTAKFGANDPDSLENSEIFNNPVWRHHVLYVREKPDYRLVCWPYNQDDLQVHIEAINGNILHVTDSAWRAIKGALRVVEPSLDKAVLVSGQSNREFLFARTGFWSEVGRRENLIPIVAGFAAIVYAIVGVTGFARDDAGRFIAGCITAVVTALVVVVWAVVDARKGTLRWG